MSWKATEMAYLLRMPEVSANLTEAVLAEWSVKDNQAFSADDVLATIETEKAVIDVDADVDGFLVRTLVHEGASVTVGDPIALLSAQGEAVTDVDQLLVELGASPQPVAAEPSAASSDPEPPEPEPGDGGSSLPPLSTARIFISPLARKLAEQAELDPAALVGTGPRGRIRKRDVEAAVRDRAALVAHPPAQNRTPGSVASESGAADEGPVAKESSSAGFTEVPHDRVRRTVASRLVESKRTVPHFYLRGSARLDALVALRAQVNAGAPVKVSFNDLFLKAVAVTHRAHPEMNAVWTDAAVRRLDSVDIAVAVAGERGLMTPVVRDVDTMSVTAVAAAVQDLVARANAGRLQQGELEGGSITVSNLGMFGTEEFAAIINPPQAAILAIGGIREEPVVHNGAVAVGRVARFVLSVDHRPVDGALAAQWMRTLVSVLEEPIRILR